jgi:rhodanese-related sulfurtransferase
VRGGRVKNITPPEAAALMKEGWIVVDVRPPNETEIARIRGAVEVPLFVVDDEASFGNFIKQAMAFGMGGWWLGGAHMRPNGKFLSQVESQAPKDAKIIVVCQKGLRSLAASEQLARAGYTTIAWVNGGLDTARPGEVPTVGDVDVRFAGIGGLSALIGWTEVQQETSGQNLAGFPFWAILGVLGLASAYQVMDLLSLDFSKVGGQW